VLQINVENLRMQKLPHIWCPGCGNGIALSALTRAIDKLGYDHDEVAIVSGIGCSSRSPGYLNFNTLHTTHGRAIAFATGLKIFKPKMKVFIVTGDGDCTAIGGNHFIHAARRNIDLNVILFNNNIYGMTGGQASPMTPFGRTATTAPYGTVERNFDIMELAKAAGATFCGRATAAHPRLIESLIVKAAQNKGFSVVEAMLPCPIGFGRRNKLGGPVEMMKYLEENSVRVQKAQKMSEEELKGKFVIGEFYNKPAPEYIEEYDKIIAKLKK
jgi:2-oxoglutarate ferredoxin oxidoreductase subunit beta